ncbi:sensor histidine kinase [Streptomyces hoynatensis]|uniref:histidine kinase n=1 Tax=Streptomyces hoynatensis TaxID=1141874 RepID=A0A3A9YZ24_9ACTN|nr:ATP-binding protein [Streptomyces hoynatensis]RKN41311.1 ATP-binding protein [Streptomyces hoynatensis]
MPEQQSHRARPARLSLALLLPGEGEPGARSRLLRLAVLPAALVTAIAVVVVAYGLTAPQQDPGGLAARWGVPLGGAVLAGFVLARAAAAAVAEAAEQATRLAALRRHATRVRVELQALLRKVERGERIRPPAEPASAEPGEPGELPYEQLRHEIESAGYAAESAVARAATLAGAAGGTDERVEVFVNLARRLQSFVHRQLEYLDELENDVEDPELLKGLFHLDHLATRIRRHAENLAVLGGAVSRRQWSRPVGMTEVLRSCIAEVEHYRRVRLVPPIEGTLRGHAVADVVHLLAELVENATEFSAPQTQVLLRVQRVTAGLAIEVEDRGLGMTAAEQRRMNAILSGAERMDVAQLLEDGRVGLFVVSTLAKRHDIQVQLQSNIYGGVQAVLVLPRELLGDEAEGYSAAYFVPGRAIGPAAELAPPEAPATRAVVDALAPPPPPSAGQPPATPPATPPAAPLGAAPQAPAAQERQPGAQPGPGAEAKPPLPRRRRSRHLVPRRRESGPSVADFADEPPVQLDRGLMAAFRRGASLAEKAEER